MGRPLKNLEGQVFGRLTVLRRGEDAIRKDGKRDTTWICQCSCENKTIIQVRSCNLKSGKTNSCGCLRTETIKKERIEQRKKNKYNLEGDYGIGFTTNTGNEFYFDLEDYDKIKNYSWYENENGYICAWKNKYMHRIIMGVNECNTYIDHIGGEKTVNDNRKCNLRIASASENAMNTKISTRNKTGEKGVIFNGRKWEAFISINKNKVRLGIFDTKEEAIKSRKEAEYEYYKEYSYDESQQIYRENIL